MSTEPAAVTAITPDDLRTIEEELLRSPRPRPLRELAETLAFRKTAGQRAQDVKKYDPRCRYEIGDLIYKEYDENLPVGSKHTEHFQGAVILRVTDKVSFRQFNCEMLEIDYPGGGLFRKYVEYMKKTHTQVLLPSAQDGECVQPESMGRGDDPKMAALPITDRDLRLLEKHLRTELTRSKVFFGWNDLWHLAAKKVEVDEARLKAVEAALSESGRSARIEDLVRRLFAVEPSGDTFELLCLSLNAALDKKGKKDFVLVSAAGWGTWHLKKVLSALPEGRPLAAPTVPLPAFDTHEKPELSTVASFPVKVYLTWREILSGGVRVPRSLGKELGKAREYAFTDSEEGRSYTCYYYPAGNYFLGLDEFYTRHNIPQGTSLTLEKSGPEAFKFWIKKSKKKIAVPRLAYDAAADRFQATGEEAFSFAEPNKIIYIEKVTLDRLLPLAEEREDKNLQDFLVLVYADPALATAAHTLHYLRAYHLIDLLKATTQEDVETTLLNSPDFAKADKKKGIFIYEKPFEAAEEESIAEALGLTLEPEPEPALEGLEEPLTAEEAAIEAAAEAQFEPVYQPEPMPEPVPRPRVPEPPPDGAPKKKPLRKKPKGEGDKGLRPRKSERRVIEERIVEEESEAEALSAVKEEEERREVAARIAREKKEEAKPAAKPKEEPKFGFFAEMLKSALKQQKPEEDKDKGKEKDKGKGGQAAAAGGEPEDKAETSEPAEGSEERRDEDKTGASEPDSTDREVEDKD